MTYFPTCITFSFFSCQIMTKLMMSQETGNRNCNKGNYKSQPLTASILLHSVLDCVSESCLGEMLKTYWLYFPVGQFRHHPQPGGGPEETCICWAGVELLGAEEAVEEQRAADPPAAGQHSANQSEADGQCCCHSHLLRTSIALECIYCWNSVCVCLSVLCRTGQRQTRHWRSSWRCGTASAMTWSELDCFWSSSGRERSWRGRR